MLPIPSTSEFRRLQALASYEVLDTIPEDDYEAITQIAAHICQTPISLITLVDRDRQWFKSVHGLSIRQTPRAISFCHHAIQHPTQLMEVSDALADDRFATNPLVTGDPHIVFYAGVPLVDAEGFALGTLCVIDHQTRHLSPQQATVLNALARQVVTQLQLRRSQAQLRKAGQTLQLLNDRLHESNQVLSTVVDTCPVGLERWRAVREGPTIVDFESVFTNPVKADLDGLPGTQRIGHSLKNLFPHATTFFDRLVNVVQTNQPQRYQEQRAGLNQTMVWQDITLTPCGDGVLCTAQDITQLKETEHQLRTYSTTLNQLVAERTAEVYQLSALNQAILQHAGQAIVSTDINGIVLTANQATETLTGYQADELTGRVAQLSPGPGKNAIPFLSYTDQRSVNLPSHATRAELATQGHFTRECVIVGKDNRQVPILLTSSVLQDQNGTPMGYVGIATDISALKKAEEALQQKNRELNTFFEGALDMHCISNSRGLISEVNGAFQRALGYSASELIAIPFLQLIHPDEQKEVYQHLLIPILRQPVRNQINQFRRKDGTYRIIEWNAIGIEEMVYGSARDITERQENETQVRQLNQRLQLATQSVGLGIWEIDYERDRLLWDDRLWEIHGLEPGRADWSFSDYLTLVHPDDLAAFLDRVQLDTHNDTLWNQTRIIRPDGAIRYVETNGILIRNPQGKPAWAIGVMWDVTERKRDEATLLESQQRFREIADNVDEVFWIHSVEPFELLYINSAYKRVFGISDQADLSGAYSFLDTVLEEDRDRVKIEFDKYQQGQEVTVQCRVQGTHLSIHWLQIKTFVMRNDQGSAVRYIGIVNDITSQKETEFVLQQSLAREQELNQLKSQFVSMASHEFRTPLTVIQNSVDLIKLYLELPTSKARESVQTHLKVIRDQIERVTTLLTDLLTIGTIEAGKIVYTPQWVDVARLCDRLVTTHSNGRSDGRTVQVSSEGMPRPVYVDKKLLSHVLDNLLSNAFKFSSGISPRLRIVFTEENLVIQVIDAGIGVPAREQSTLFQAFSRASNTVGIQGTGLGLAIARQFVELHGGQLTMESEENMGTTFTIRLPAGRDGQAPEM